MAASFFIEKAGRSTAEKQAVADVIVEISPTRFFVTKNRFGTCESFSRVGFGVFIEKLTHELGAPVSVSFQIKQRTSP